MIRRGTRRWTARGWFVVLLALAATPAGAEVLRLKDGTSVEGTVKRTEGGYDVTDGAGTVVHIDSDRVQRIDLTTRPVGNVEAQQRLASLRRSVENQSDVNAIIDQFSRFIDQNRSSPAAQDAEHDLAGWRERRAKGMVKVGAQWVSAEERRALLDRVGGIVDQARQALADARLKEAEAYVQQALDVDPNNAGAAYLRGVMLYHLDQLQPARKALDTSASSLKDHAPTLNNIAVILWRQNQQMGALNFYLQAMAASPGTRGVLDNVAEALNALPDKERQFPLAKKAARVFADQDTDLQRRMAAAGFYRWGSGWVDKARYEKLQAIEKEIKAKIDDLSTQYDATKKKVDQIDTDMDDDLKRMRLLEQTSVAVDANGNVFQLPLPPRYFELQRDVRQLSTDRADYVAKLDGLRTQARRVQQQMPTPRFTGQQRMMGAEGTPGAPPVPPTAGLTRPEPAMPTELMPPAATRPTVAATEPVRPATVPAVPTPPPEVTEPPLPAGIGKRATTRPAAAPATAPSDRVKVPDSLLAPG